MYIVYNRIYGNVPAKFTMYTYVCMLLADLKNKREVICTRYSDVCTYDDTQAAHP
jgi:hypothetical protein